ncbi:MAG: hypothetical protein KBT63_08850 [Porticoccaceae bacterium]|nr:hypothetical protein [Porticoccaceae bacterium]
MNRIVSVRRLVLDVLKPHQPNALEFSRAIAEVGIDYRVHLTVLAAIINPGFERRKV